MWLLPENTFLTVETVFPFLFFSDTSTSKVLSAVIVVFFVFFYISTFESSMFLVRKYGGFFFSCANSKISVSIITGVSWLFK